MFAALAEAGHEVLPRIRRMLIILFEPVWGEHAHLAEGCELLHVIRGRISLEIGPTVFEANSGDTLVVPPGTMHRDRFDPDRGLEILFCSLDWPWLTEDFATRGNAALLRLPEHRKAEIGGLFHQLAADMDRSLIEDQVLAQTRVLTILTMLLRSTYPSNLAREPSAANARCVTRRRELVREARAYLERNYAKALTLDGIAAALGVSAYHLSHVFSEESGMPLFVCLTTLRMNKAKLLLLEGRHTVAEVAHAVGYADAHHFAKAFHQRVGCVPRDYAAHTRPVPPPSTVPTRRNPSFGPVRSRQRT